ncbi:hypothetical protein P4N68_02985 [Corynebacterium felinum]|uniref:Uncharacterized protein n=1 Tax=Corynebacterium felinum TaxID=131318 RepID=A0ABU2BCB7_9CORY|nr:hypothetical protein [Corynebacterium felinum]MDF5820048.1 hypothetical protein [Corynebacterium felinum]MDR7356238.1 hypothetical protein [Corynebacterium felinum]
MFFKRKSKAPAPHSAEHTAPAGQHIYFTLNLNARLQPYVRHDFEDDLESQLTSSKLGVLDGGGTLLNSEGEFLSCDINFVMENPSPEKISAALTMISHLPWVPKGSRVVWEENGTRHTHEVGHLEGMALYLNGTDLPVEVYETANLAEIVENMNELMSPHGRIMSHWEGPKETALYFYGTDFHSMCDCTDKYRAETPLLEKSRVERIA